MQIHRKPQVQRGMCGFNMKVRLCWAVLFVWFSAAKALDCVGECDPSIVPPCCPSAFYAKDQCGCEVCARDLSQDCGGPFNIAGTCAYGLVCVKTLARSEHPQVSSGMFFNIHGVCILAEKVNEYTAEKESEYHVQTTNGLAADQAKPALVCNGADAGRGAKAGCGATAGLAVMVLLVKHWF